MEKLTPQQERFCREYAKSGNATEAARLAGYGPADPKRTAMRLLQNQEVKKRIARLNKDIADAIDVSAVTLANEYKKIAFANFMEAYKAFITSSDPDISPDLSAAISDISIVETTKVRRDGTTTTTRRIKLKMHNKLRALEKLSKMCGVENGIPEGEEEPVPMPTMPFDLELLSAQAVSEIYQGILIQEEKLAAGGPPMQYIPEENRYKSGKFIPGPQEYIHPDFTYDHVKEWVENGEFLKIAKEVAKDGIAELSPAQKKMQPLTVFPKWDDKMENDQKKVANGDILPGAAYTSSQNTAVSKATNEKDDTPTYTAEQIAYLGYDPSIYKPPRRLGDIQL